MTDNSKLILVLDDNDEREMRSDRTGARLLSSGDVQIQRYPVTGNTPIARALRARGADNRLAYLVRSPYDPLDYRPLNEAALKLAEAKLHYTSQLCNILGAKSVEFKRSKKSLHEFTREGSADGWVKTAKWLPKLGMSGSFRQNRIKDHRETLGIQKTFHGSAPDFDAAERFLDEYNLRGDLILTTLLAEHRKNPIVTQTYKLDLSYEARGTFELVFNLGLPTYLKNKATFDTVERIFNAYTVEFVVNF